MRYGTDFRRRRRRPFDLEGPGYTGRGELRRYGHAPVDFGPDHTYDYHFGDRFGYGPDFYTGEARIRRDPELLRHPPARPPARRRRDRRRVRRRYR